jgi:hypothetical protein
MGCRRSNQLAGGLPRQRFAVVVAHQRQAQVDPSRHAGAGQHLGQRLGAVAGRRFAHIDAIGLQAHGGPHPHRRHRSPSPSRSAQSIAATLAPASAHRRSCALQSDCRPPGARHSCRVTPTGPPQRPPSARLGPAAASPGAAWRHGLTFRRKCPICSKGTSLEAAARRRRSL